MPLKSNLWLFLDKQFIETDLRGLDRQPLEYHEAWRIHSCWCEIRSWVFFPKIKLVRSSYSHPHALVCDKIHLSPQLLCARTQMETIVVRSSDKSSSTSRRCWLWLRLWRVGYVLLLGVPRLSLRVGPIHCENKLVILRTQHLRQHSLHCHFSEA